MNELRYAARQLFNAQRLFDREPLSEGDKSVITKRLIIAEQYFLNSEHDIWDAIVGYFDEVIDRLDSDLGVTAITVHFNEYPLLRTRRDTCVNLISEAREHYDLRKNIYDTLRTEHFPHFAASHKRLLDAEIAAMEVRSRLETDLRRATTEKKALDKINLGLAIFSAAVSVLAIFLTIYLWAWAREDFCAANAKRPVLGMLCSVGPPAKP